MGKGLILLLQLRDLEVLAFPGQLVEKLLDAGFADVAPDAEREGYGAFLVALGEQLHGTHVEAVIADHAENR